MAYLDPGTGSLLIQLLLAGLLGVGVAVKVYWKKITGWFEKNKKEDQTFQDPTAISDQPDLD